MDILKKIMDVLPVILPALVAFNVVLSGVAQFLHAIKQNVAEGIVGKVAGLLAKVIDFVTGNIAHK